MRTVRLYDTKSGQTLPLPQEDRPLRLYACGPTVYGRIHLGNARPYVLFCLLKRFLEEEGYRVNLAINITDINDKIYAAARAAARPSKELAAAMADHYIADTDRLGLGRPDFEPRASSCIPQIISYIQTLLERGHAYVVPYEEEGRQTADVYFRVRSDPAYGSLSHRRLEEMDQGEGVEGQERKADPLDFALWKGRKAGEDSSWPAPWGEGRPGWHIECSAMAESALGGPVDVHGGGTDLIFPHHENESAQARCARGRELALVWLHNGMVQAVGEKMAKSVGNIVALHEVVDRYGPAATVLYLISAHYRQPLAFSEEALDQAAAGARRLQEALQAFPAAAAEPPPLRPYLVRFWDALAADFNTPRALAALFSLIREANRRRDRGAAVGGKGLHRAAALLGLAKVPSSALPEGRATFLLREREAARARRDFALADRLREELRALGYGVRDGPNGSTLVPLR